MSLDGSLCVGFRALRYANMALRNRTSVAGSTIGDPDVTSRRIKSSGKYSNIAATLDTGRTVTKARFTSACGEGSDLRGRRLDGKRH